MTQQGLRQASAYDLSLFPTASNYNEDLLRLFDALAGGGEVTRINLNSDELPA